MRDEEGDADPLDAHPARPLAQWHPQPAAGIADEHEGAPGAEDIPGRQQRDNEPAAILHPRQHRGQIRRGNLRTEQTVQDENGRDKKQDQLQ